jgi:membrane protein implicated in regulation of membrane protease activity
VHVSRPRVALRAALLTLGGGFMLWRAFDARRAAQALEGADAALASRMALVWALVGALALVTAAAAALALRPRRRHRSLRLDDLPGGGRAPPKAQ